MGRLSLDEWKDKSDMLIKKKTKCCIIIIATLQKNCYKNFYQISVFTFLRSTYEKIFSFKEDILLFSDN